MEPSPCKSDFELVNGVRLHFLDWGGRGPALLFLAGLGCNAYIFSRLASCFRDSFHVLALTRRGHGDSETPETGYDLDTLTEDLRLFLDARGIKQASLVGHSMAGIELSQFASLYPQRVQKLVYLDFWPDRTSQAFQEMRALNPFASLQPPGLDQDTFTFQEYTAAMRRAYPSFNAIWSEVMDAHAEHELMKDAGGKVIERMSDAVNQAFMETINHYELPQGRIQAPVLSFHAIPDSRYAISEDWMTPAQIRQIRAYFDTGQRAWFDENLALFRRCLPQAQTIILPAGHHYCFLKEEARVVKEMRGFLLEG